MSEPTRRDIVKTLAAGSAAVTAGCLQVKESVAEKVKMKMKQPSPILERSPLPVTGPWPTVDPFLFCVHHNDKFPVGDGKLGPKASLAGRNIGSDFSNRDGWSMYHGDSVPGFPRHPHRGFETVTIVERGLVDHADSLGAAARYGQGDVQWLTAGDGINHAEMMPLLDTKGENPLDLYQIWLNLPAKNKRVKPRFFMYWGEKIPTTVEKDSSGHGIEVKIVAGAMKALNALPPPPDSYASSAQADVGIYSIRLDAGATWQLPAAKAGVKRSLYFVEGRTMLMEGERVASRHRYGLEPTANVSIAATDGAVRLLLLDGRPIGEPVVQHGPFVMNTYDEIRQAIRDYQRTQFGGWPWPNSGPVHGLEAKRFARHVDGRVETPPS